MTGSQPVRKSHRKVRSGCQTCKRRKVKCDESWPCCQRCTLSGLACAGYGIWGGGSSSSTTFSTSQDPSSHDGSSTCASAIRKDGSKDCVIPRPQYPVFLKDASVLDGQYFEWFQLKTSTKLSGAFLNEFWTRIVFQATVSEPAVLHALLALSCVQMIDMFDGYSFVRETQPPDVQERYALGHYTQSIQHIQALFQTADPSKNYVVVITCILFASLELFRGRAKSACTHLRNGVEFLNASRLSQLATCSFNPSLVRCVNADHGIIVGLLYRMFALVTLMNHDARLASPTSYPLQQSLNDSFTSLDHARSRLDQLILEVRHLSVHFELTLQGNTHVQVDLLRQQQRHLRRQLSTWMALCTQSSPVFQAQSPGRFWSAMKLLMLYHKLATVQLEAALAVHDEMVYDSHLSAFDFLLQSSLELYDHFVPGTCESFIAQNQHSNSTAFLDMGWIPPLYYAAIKCRDHRIRHAALKALDVTEHREMVWDARVAAFVARRVVQLEEESYFADCHAPGSEPVDAQTFRQGMLLPNTNSSMPILPQEYRISDVEFASPEGPTPHVVLSYVRLGRDMIRQKQRETGDLLSGSWTTCASVENDAQSAEPSIS